MNKELLINGYVVKVRNGETFMYLKADDKSLFRTSQGFLGEVLISKSKVLNLANYDNNLMFPTNSDYDVVSIYAPTFGNLNTALSLVQSILVCETEFNIDWNNVDKDTKVLVSDNQVYWDNAYFAGTNDLGEPFVYCGGKTSFTASTYMEEQRSYSPKFIKLYKGDVK